MIQRDVLMRQIHQMVQALAQALFRKQQHQYEAADEALIGGVEEALGVGFADLLAMERAELLALCTAGGAISGDKAVALADLLREVSDEASAPLARERARWLYEAALASGAPVPLDVYDRIAALADE